MNMTGIKLSDDKKIASIEPGNIWGDVYRELTKFDVTVIGGRLCNIGVGGLTTGGMARQRPHKGYRRLTWHQVEFPIFPMSTAGLETMWKATM